MCQELPRNQLFGNFSRPQVVNLGYFHGVKLNLLDV